MEENKKLENEQLENVDGGRTFLAPDLAPDLKAKARPVIELVTDEKEETKSTDCYPFIHCSPIR